MDKARRQTDKILVNMEDDIKALYDTSPEIKRALKNLNDYMAVIQKETKSEYDAYMSETDVTEKRKLKKIYSDKVRKLMNSKQFIQRKRNFVTAVSGTNRRALDIVNSNTARIYAINYNQVAVECKKVGIKVNGESSD